jgi:threonyl-tRNA synthetase
MQEAPMPASQFHGSEGPADHRRLGRALRLFTTDPLAGSGLPLWLPDGAVIRAELQRLAAEEAARGGCQQVYTPVLAKRELYERSGHWAKFADDMFPPMMIGGEEYVLRPANCPHHVLVYAAEQRSFRDLPVRLAELGAMFRSELSGVLGGLHRVRQINLDDTHVFCAAGREETLSTIQVDFNLPQRFDLRFTGSDGASHRPVMIHRGILSSMERLVAHLIERCGGAFPPWLAPVQVSVLPVAEQHAGLGRRLTDRIGAAGLRAEFGPPDATLGARIRRARERRIPYVAVIGDREADTWPDGPGQQQGVPECPKRVAAAWREGAGRYDPAGPEGGQVALRLRDGRRLDSIAAGRLIAEVSRQVTERSGDLGFR